MANAKSIIHRDQVHGDVHYDPLSVALLDTNTLQRLGRVYQLGYSHLVFRGGTHSRLSHVMGAAHVAGKIVDALKRNYRQGRAFQPTHVVSPNEFLPWPTTKKKPTKADEQLRTTELRWDLLRHITIWAALLHDAGHVPLGHTLEDEFEGIFQKHDDFASPRSPFLWNEQGEIYKVLTNKSLYPKSFSDLEIEPDLVWHAVMLICFYKGGKSQKSNEKHSVFLEALVDEENKIDKERKALRATQKRKHADHKLLRLDQRFDFVVNLKAAIRHDDCLFHPYMADIVANTICADYLDYVKRDPLNVGLDVLRDDRILSHFYVSKQEIEKSYRMALALLDRHGKARLDVCTGVVEQVRQRYRFAELIYYHKTKVAASAMFAKAMALIGKPEEIPTNPIFPLAADEIHDVALSLAEETETLDEFKKAHLPESLLSPEIGDESLHLLLAQRAIRNVEREVLRPTPTIAGRKSRKLDTTSVDVKADKIETQLRGLALLQGISRRQLYKVAVSINANQFGGLTKGAAQVGPVEDRLQFMLKKLRDNEARKTFRSEIEDKMADAAGWPRDTILLYVPPRKNQAKGIETFAFDGLGVVQLNEHPAVSEKVNELSRDYQKLWRLLVLVHPEYRHRFIELSEALDALIKALWAAFGEDLFAVDLHNVTKIHQLIEVASFPYVRIEYREAARMLEALTSTHDIQIDWSLFETAVRTTEKEEIVDSKDYAERAYLLHKLKEKLETPVNGDEQIIKILKSALVGAELDKRKRNKNKTSKGFLSARAAELDALADRLTKDTKQYQREALRTTRKLVTS